MQWRLDFCSDEDLQLVATRRLLVLGKACSVVTVSWRCLSSVYLGHPGALPANVVVFRTSGVAGRSERLEQKDEVTKFAIHSEGPQSTFWRAMASELCVVLQNESIALGPACVCCVVSVFATQRSVLAVSC